MNFRIGQGFDVHKFVPERKLFICGVEIPYELGLLGHSDADVAIHALCDALLGAAALGDIGKHFPDSDPHYSGIDSKILLEHCCRLLRDNNFEINNVDVTIIAQAPKMAPHIPDMVKTLAGVMKVDSSAVSVKATTTEHLGFTGRKEGIAALASALIYIS